MSTSHAHTHKHTHKHTQTHTHKKKSKTKSNQNKTKAMSATKLQVKKPVPSDLTISQSITPEKIERIAENIGIQNDELTTCGPWRGKVDVKVLERLKGEVNGNYVSKI